MTSAAEIVRLQAAMLGSFMTPAPGRRYMATGVLTGKGEQFSAPVSAIGQLVDQALLGPRAGYGISAFSELHGPGVYEGNLSVADTCAPLVAHGVSRARAYRIQENMTEPIERRADALSLETTFDVYTDGAIMPPRMAGWAWFEQPLRILTGRREEHEPVVGAITWNTVVKPEKAGGEWPGDVLWLAVLWEDRARYRWWVPGTQDTTKTNQPGAEHERFIPLHVRLVLPGEHLDGTPMAPPPGRRLDAAVQGLAVRNPQHVVAALWQMLNEEIPGDADHSTEPTDRAAQRAARREGVTTDTREVTTVVLRRERRPTQHPGTGRKPTYRVEIPAGYGYRWIGPRNSPDRKKVLRPIRKHMSSNDDSLPVRTRVVVNDLRR